MLLLSNLNFKREKIDRNQASARKNTERFSPRPPSVNAYFEKPTLGWLLTSTIGDGQGSLLVRPGGSALYVAIDSNQEAIKEYRPGPLLRVALTSFMSVLDYPQYVVVGGFKTP